MDSVAPKRYTAPLCPGRMPVPVRLTIWLLTLAAAMLLPALARAHAILEESDPPAGASVKAGPVDLRFRYNSRIDQGRSRLTLIRPDHSHGHHRHRARRAARHPRFTLELAPGAYIIRWQVLAVDGHITRGDVPLTVTAP